MIAGFVQATGPWPAVNLTRKVAQERPSSDYHAIELPSSKAHGLAMLKNCSHLVARRE
jgi:hypothetical protein